MQFSDYIGLHTFPATMPQQYLSRYFKPKEDKNKGTDTANSRDTVTYRSRTAIGKSTTEKVSEALFDEMHISNAVYDRP